MSHMRSLTWLRARLCTTPIPIGATLKMLRREASLSRSASAIRWCSTNSRAWEIAPLIWAATLSASAVSLSP